MSYLKKSSLLQQQQELRKFVDERVENEEQKVKERIYQWLNDNRYFTDNELFDFYFCVAQNLAAVEVLGGSGEKIVRAKIELEESAKVYTTKFIDLSQQINQKLESQLINVRTSQDKLDLKMNQVLKKLEIERKNLNTISTGLVNSMNMLVIKQKQLITETAISRKLVFQLILILVVIIFLILLVYLI